MISPGYGPADAYRGDSAADERTVLSWQRTALALVVAAVVIGRLAAGTLGPVALIGGVAAALTGAVVLLAARHRRTRPRAGVATGALTLAVITMCLLELAAVLLR